MDLVRDLTLITHFIGLAIIVGPFLMQMRSRTNFAFTWVFAGTIVQLISGLILTGLAEMRLADDPDMAVDHMKITVKFALTLLAFLAALIGYRRQKKAGTAQVESTLMPFFHTAGGLATINVILAVVWPGTVPA